MNKLYKLLLASFLLLSTTLSLAQGTITLEAASPDPTLIVRGPERAVDLVNSQDWATKDRFISLFTSAYGHTVQSNKSIYTAIQVDKEMKVTAVINGGVSKGERPAFRDKLNLTIPTGGFVVVASADNYDAQPYKKFLAENFRTGDVVKLRINGEVSTLEHVAAAGAGQVRPSIELSGDFLLTTIGTKHTISGKVVNYPAKGGKYKLQAVKDGQTIPLRINAKGEFSGKATLAPGANYFDICLLEGEREVDTRPLVVYSKEANTQASELVMWVEQFPNAKELTNDAAVEAMVANVKAAGFTAVGIDVKGPEGYVSYRKNHLSGTPYFTATTNPKKQVVDNGFDLLQSVITASHNAGIKVYTSFNFFTEGNITANDYAVLHQHKDWEEIVQRPEDKGKLLKITESARGKAAAEGKLIALAFVNPSNMEAQDFQLLRVEEVLQSYDIDGVVLDRCRYDNLYADFSHTTRNAFEVYLEQKGKTLDNFPADAFRIDKEGQLIKGQHYKEWITFRSQTIKQFTDRVRALVDEYKEKKNPNLKLAAYVGSWYEVYYQNGVNWASNDFCYNNRLNFPESEIYSSEYNQTSYLGNLDFLMIGTYYKTPKEVNRYITIGNILTGGKVPIMGSMSLPDLKVEEQGNVFRASLENSSGLMIFDYCYVDWNTFLEQMKIAFRRK